MTIINFYRFFLEQSNFVQVIGKLSLSHGYSCHLSANNLGVSQSTGGFKMYDIEGLGNECTITEASARAIMEAASKRRIGGHNERYHEIIEWERRVQKRKYRLISTTEDAFASVQSVTTNNQNKVCISKEILLHFPSW